MASRVGGGGGFAQTTARSSGGVRRKREERSSVGVGRKLGSKRRREAGKTKREQVQRDQGNLAGSRSFTKRT